jgi:hypothetical protein
VERYRIHIRQLADGSSSQRIWWTSRYFKKELSPFGGGSFLFRAVHNRGLSRN